MAYEFLAHTADVKFRAKGKTIEEMFISTSMALNETIKGEIEVLEVIEKESEVYGEDLETLLHNYLEEFLFLLDSEDFLLSRIKSIEFDKDNLKLKVVALGDVAEQYRFTNDVKAITFNEIFVKQESDSYICQIVLDV